ncbi:MAG: MFS transporter [Candidatus Heimdallarchaeota archaeon]
MAEEKSEDKFKAGQTFLIGLAFFTTFSWSLYNTQVNRALDNYFAGFILAGFTVGIIMAVDNIIGVIIQPIMGNISDNTRTRYGRRMPYIVIGVILSVIFFILIPTGFPTTFTGGGGFGQLWILLLWIFFFGISMGFYRSQAVALMPDFVKPVNRSKGNAIINIMGGIGAVIAFTLGLLIDLNTYLPFIIASVIMLVAMIILFFTIKETKSYSYQMLLEVETKEGGRVKEKKEKITLIASFKDIFKEKDKSTLLILLAIFFWFVGYQGMEALFSIYAGPYDPILFPNGVLGFSGGMASFIFNFVAIPFIIAAYPLSLLANKIGRRNCIKVGLIIMIVALLIGFLIRTQLLTIIILVFFGIGWAFVNINSIVIVWELAPSIRKIGTYTGLYYFFSVLAAIFGPALLGILRDLFGKESLLLDGAIFLIIAFILMFFVRRGEIELTEEEKLARQKAIAEL